MNPDPTVKAGLDGTAILVLLGWSMNYLPAVATLFTIAWTVLSIYSTLLDIRAKKGPTKPPSSPVPPTDR